MTCDVMCLHYAAALTDWISAELREVRSPMTFEAVPAFLITPGNLMHLQQPMNSVNCHTSNYHRKSFKNSTPASFSAATMQPWSGKLSVLNHLPLFSSVATVKIAIHKLKNEVGSSCGFVTCLNATPILLEIKHTTHRSLIPMNLKKQH